MQAQKQIVRRFEKFLAGTSGPPKSEPPAPSTPPLAGDVPLPAGELATAKKAAVLDQEQAVKKLRQDSSDDRKRKSHLISPSPRPSPFAVAPDAHDAAAAPSGQVSSLPPMCRSCQLASLAHVCHLCTHVALICTLSVA